MVNHGRSGGCITCKERRVKCDEAKPHCRLCLRLRLSCGGYKTKTRTLRFKDDSQKFCNRSQNTAVHSRSTVVHQYPATLELRPLVEPDTAVPFFLMHFASMGRDLGSTRGFFEMLIPVYCSQREDSAFSLALSVVASDLLSRWRHDLSSIQSPQNLFADAIGRLQTALRDPHERAKPATIMAILLLQFHENIAAVHDLRLAKGTHHNGAISLLPYAKFDKLDGTISAYIRRYLLHIEISSAIHMQRSLQPIAYSWLGSKDIMDAPLNPSAELDAIGASIAELQAKYLQIAPQGCPTHALQQALDGCRAEALNIDERLLAWERSVPDHWLPLQPCVGRDIDPTIPTYGSAYEIYPSCQIATIWNLWRCQRLLLAKIILVSSSTTFGRIGSEPKGAQNLDRSANYIKCTQTLQISVDSICRSVPFYLGNRTTVSDIADFTDPSILLPSYYSLPRDDNRPSMFEHNGYVPSRDDHRRHMIAQGPWHLMGTLSQLLAHFSEEHGELILNSLRPGQHEWIREQFLRVATLLGLPLERSGENMESTHQLGHQGQNSTSIKARHGAKAVRAGSLFSGGPS